MPWDPYKDGPDSDFTPFEIGLFLIGVLLLVFGIGYWLW